MCAKIREWIGKKVDKKTAAVRVETEQGLH